jgi:Kef-type K+ transport system membrane component KefB
LFFAMAGARMNLSQLLLIGWLCAIYIVARGVGKCAGAWLGATVTGVADQRRWLIGLGLQSQGGVAIALAQTASAELMRAGSGMNALASAVESVILGSTMLLFAIGPTAVRFAVTTAGEARIARTSPYKPPQR